MERNKIIKFSIGIVLVVFIVGLYLWQRGRLDNQINPPEKGDFDREYLIGRNDEFNFTEPKILDEWLVCKENFDCVITEESLCTCASGGKRVAINKTYKEPYEARLNELRWTNVQGVGCPGVVLCFDGETQCNNNKCEFVSYGWLEGDKDDRGVFYQDVLLDEEVQSAARTFDNEAICISGTYTNSFENLSLNNAWLTIPPDSINLVDNWSMTLETVSAEAIVCGVITGPGTYGHLGAYDYELSAEIVMAGDEEALITQPIPNCSEIPHLVRQDICWWKQFMEQGGDKETNCGRITDVDLKNVCLAPRWLEFENRFIRFSYPDDWGTPVNGEQKDFNRSPIVHFGKTSVEGDRKGVIKEVVPLVTVEEYERQFMSSGTEIKKHHEGDQSTIRYNKINSSECADEIGVLFTSDTIFELSYHCPEEENFSDLFEQMLNSFFVK